MTSTSLTFERAIVIIAGLFLFTGVGPNRAAGEDRITVSQLTEAWQKREQSARFARFGWVERLTHAKGSILTPDSWRRGNAMRVDVPPEDVTFDVRKTMVMDADKMRYSYDGQSFDTGQMKWIRQEYLSVSNGQVRKQYWPKGAIRHPSGDAAEEKQNFAITCIETWPFLLTYRATNLSMTPLRLARLTIARQQALLDDRPCIALEETPGPDEMAVTNVWVALEESHKIMRYTRSAEGKVVFKIDLHFSSGPGVDAILSGWNVVETKADGSLLRANTASVSECAINGTVNSDEFELAFPDGTLVTEQAPKSDGGAFTTYIVRPDGGKRIVTDGERGATYEQLLNSEPGMAFAPHRPRAQALWVLLVLSIGVILLLVSLRVARRLRASM